MSDVSALASKSPNISATSAYGAGAGTWCEVLELAQQTRSTGHGCRPRRALTSRAALTKLGVST